MTDCSNVLKTDHAVTMNNDNEQILSLLDKIKQRITAPQSSSAEHAQTLADIHRLQLAVETPLETIYRIGHQTWQNACVRIALEIGVFDMLLSKQGEPVGVQQLASPSGADVVFLVRVMRVVVALGLCAEIGEEEYQANSKTNIMTVSQGIYSFKSWFDIFTPTAAKLPEHMCSQKYQNPTTSADSAFAYTNGSEFWKHLDQTPKHSLIFNQFMATRRQGRQSWYDIYPVSRELSSSLSNIDTEAPEKEKVLFVDVGGNQGHDLVQVRSRCHGLVGKMILQDLPHVVADASFDTGDGVRIEAMPHDFFQPQPVKRKNALGYHFRAIFHDWPDEACHQILSHTAAAMKPQHSKLLISEFVLPDTGTALFPATLDIQMMGLHAGMERSEHQWRSLLDSAGLKVIKIWQEVKGGESVIEARLKD
ncbi:MAG: hypothetical protein Q9169_008069 [Polycauliona sp. 2 TL-2023]